MQAASPAKRRVSSASMSSTETMGEELSDVDETAPVQTDFWANFGLLTFLYMLQGIPLGLAGGTLPYLLKAEGASYTAIGLFNLATMPFSAKLLWAPIVDGKWLSWIGRRKTWIIPCQTLGGIGMLALSFGADAMVASSSTLLGPCFFVLVLAFATQDIAVDGWALEILSKENLSYASTAQSVGQNIGYFAGFTVFLGAQSFGWITLNQFLWWWGWIFLLSSAYLWFFKSEDPAVSTQAHESVASIYKQLWSITLLPDFQKFAIYLLTYHLGLVANDRALFLRFIELGFSKELLATFGFAGFPLGILFAVYAGRWARGGHPMSGPFFYGNLLRFGTAFLGQVLLWVNGNSVPTAFMIGMLFLLYALATLGSCFVFVSACAYFNVISPKAIGGTYLTYLNTVSNLGKSWAGLPVLFLIDTFGFSIVNVCLVVGGTIYLIKSRAYLKSIEDVKNMHFAASDSVKI